MKHRQSTGRSTVGAAAGVIIALFSFPAPHPGAAEPERNLKPDNAAAASALRIEKEHDPRPASNKPVNLPRMVVTATKTETEASRTAASITTIDRKQIEREQLRFVVDALRRVPGVTVADRGTPGSVAGVIVRGMKTEHTAVLIDGRPVPANLAGAYNLEHTTLDNVERIEVLRGPAASLYGGRTIGGVINIITRSGRGLAQPESRVFAEAGSYGTFREGVSSLGSAGAFDWSVEASRTDIAGRRINSRYEQDSAVAAFGYDATDALRFDINFRHYDALAGTPGNRFSNDPDDELRTRYWSVSPRVVWQTSERWTQSLIWSSSWFRQTASTPNEFVPNNNRVTVQSQFLEFQSVVRPAENWSITAGAWFQDQAYHRFNGDPVGPFNPGGLSYDIDQSETNWALFLQSQAEVLPGLNVSGGVRFDRYSDFEDAVTWRAGVSYRVPVIRTLLHANYGTAFAPPTPQDREPALFGNAMLAKPERSRGFEAGIEQPLPVLNATIHATWFHNQLRDTFQFDLATFALQAIGRARTQGLEVGAEWAPCPAFTAAFDYTYLEADDLTTGSRLVRRPRHSLTGSLRCQPHRDLDLTLSAVQVMGREDFHPLTFAQVDIEDYLVLRLAMNWRVCPRLEFFGRVENLLGDDYEEVAGFPAHDTGVYGGLRWRF